MALSHLRCDKDVHVAVGGPHNGDGMDGKTVSELVVGEYAAVGLDAVRIGYGNHYVLLTEKCIPCRPGGWDLPLRATDAGVWRDASGGLRLLLPQQTTMRVRGPGEPQTIQTPSSHVERVQVLVQQGPVHHRVWQEKTIFDGLKPVVVYPMIDVPYPQPVETTLLSSYVKASVTYQRGQNAAPMRPLFAIKDALQGWGACHATAVAIGADGVCRVDPYAPATAFDEPNSWRANPRQWWSSLGSLSLKLSAELLGKGGPPPMWSGNPWYAVERHGRHYDITLSPTTQITHAAKGAVLTGWVPIAHLYRWNPELGRQQLQMAAGVEL